MERMRMGMGAKPAPRKTQRPTASRLLAPFLCPIMAMASCQGGDAGGRPDYKEKRMEMVKSQLIARGIKDERVLEAMRKVERHLFLPEDMRRAAYDDGAQPIGEGQTISQPYIVALMTETLNLKPSDRVLEIGTGSGYQAAILGELADEVYSIEILPTLAERARGTLNDLGYENIRTRVGDGFKGWPDQAPFDAVIVTCSPSNVPKPLQDQLAEGGSMVIPVGDSYSQSLVHLVKQQGKLRRINEIPVRFVPMVDEKGDRY